MNTPTDTPCPCRYCGAPMESQSGYQIIYSCGTKLDFTGKTIRQTDNCVRITMLRGELNEARARLDVADYVGRYDKVLFRVLKAEKERDEAQAELPALLAQRDRLAELLRNVYFPNWGEPQFKRINGRSWLLERDSALAALERTKP